MIRKFISSIVFLLGYFICQSGCPAALRLCENEVPLVFETKEDLSAYRLFVEFSGVCEEVKSIKGKAIFISDGGGARFASGNLFAIPKTAVTGFGKNMTWEQKQQLGSMLREEKIEGVVKLGNHTFTVDYKEGVKAPIPVYLIKKEDNVLKLVPKDVKPGKNVSSNEIEDDFHTTDTSASMRNRMMGGVFLTSSMFLGGLFFIRRKKIAG